MKRIILTNNVFRASLAKSYFFLQGEGGLAKFYFPYSGEAGGRAGVGPNITFPYKEEGV